ncbi:ATPase family protein, partial [Necator americanus]
DPRWASVIVRARRIRNGLDRGATPFTLARGVVLEAAQEGHWLLIDEINLAPPESLDAIVHAISNDVHPNFRLFACMNPATDAGKRRLPASVRTRFVEFYVDEVTDAHQLALIVSTYLPSMNAAAVAKLVNFYLYAKQLYPSSYSLRTFCRALTFAAENMFGSEERSLYEGVCMAFLTNLDAEAKEKMRSKIGQTFRVNSKVPMPSPSGKADYVQVEGYWIERGSNLPQEDPNYVVTKTVKANLAEIARITSSGRFPILLEGETSAGKTSIVCHLARVTGNAIIRINNHEHTDVQEYMGSYVGDANGRLVFREGALVKAVREGIWVILDELNLAPTDIIETLNRLLDDNRELFVPELNTVVQAHPRFRLFATQNPAGSYGGRKRLSRALMSRFVVLKFDNLPLDELSSMVSY